MNKGKTVDLKVGGKKARDTHFEAKEAKGSDSIAHSLT